MSEKDNKYISEDPIQSAIDFGIDVTLLYERKRLSPTKRMERHQQMLEFIEELKRVGERKYGKS